MDSILVKVHNSEIPTLILQNQWTYPDTEIIEAYMKKPLDIDETTPCPF
jgi:hypothetical protein